MPALIADGYRERFSLGLLTAAGSLGLLFPPSLPLILYGVVAEVPIGDLFVGGFLPGVLMLGALAALGVREGLVTASVRRPFTIREAVAATCLPLPRRDLVRMHPVMGRDFLNRPLPFDRLQRHPCLHLCAETPSLLRLHAQHLADPVAYRRDRRKDQLLQENGYLVLRFLAEDVGKELDHVLDAILRALSHRRPAAPTTAPLIFARPKA